MTDGSVSQAIDEEDFPIIWKLQAVVKSALISSSSVGQVTRLCTEWWSPRQCEQPGSGLGG